VPPLVGQSDDSEAFSNIVLGYINLVLMVEDIDDKFEHYLEHPVLLAALLVTSSLSSARVCFKCFRDML
jgi:hypothetical protein